MGPEREERIRPNFPWNLLLSGEAFSLSSFLWVGANTCVPSGVPLVHGDPGENETRRKLTSTFFIAPGGALEAPDTVSVTDGKFQLFLRGRSEIRSTPLSLGQLGESE